MTTILHVARRPDWEEAQSGGVYAPPVLARDGFLHACTEAQLAFVLGRHFPGAVGLVVLAVDAEATGAAVEWVRSEPDQAPFPHLHGPIPVRAVREVRDPGRSAPGDGGGQHGGGPADAGEAQDHAQCPGIQAPNRL